MFIQWIFLISSVILVSSGRISERIVGGYPVPISSAPWQASIQEYGIHQCGAAIYSDQILITAAHCIPQHPYGSTVRVGATNRNFGGQVAEIANIIVHEGYHEINEIPFNDIAVIRLSSRLRMDDTVRSIPLADSTPPIGSPASVSGWGRVGYKQPQSDILLETAVSIADWHSCRNSYRQVVDITKDMICAAGPGRDACTHDSGGPLVSDGKLVGIVSFGKGCAFPGYPGVYVNVAEYKPWILSAIQRI
ncbi:trypsin delta-like [Drosophila subpulchrella]|uniref:trypsin delta-like n=1 Tax=Drosophila subpulchrella TaxID=1486046 RepID=UPI0018A18E60|nr:trypsin delta-like [Drosophila subpulchrella]